MTTGESAMTIGQILQPPLSSSIVVRSDTASDIDSLSTSLLQHHEENEESLSAHALALTMHKISYTHVQTMKMTRPLSPVVQSTVCSLPICTLLGSYVIISLYHSYSSISISGQNL